MILLALALLGFAVADLLRWSPGEASDLRTGIALIGATGVTTGVAALSGFEVGGVVAVGGTTFAVVAVWLLFDRAPLKDTGPGYPLAWILLVLVALFAISGSVDASSGSLEEWYADLAFAFVQSIPVDQFVLGIGAGLFLLASGNRIVRLVLEAAGTPIEAGETKLRGGRLLGPMERLIVAAMILAGSLAGAAFVIAAKGLLRFPEIRSSAEQPENQPDQVTEYFLIGTFSSLLLAGTMATLVLAAG